jgi:hypothetical protein
VGEGRQYTRRDNLEQFRTTESQAWASVNNSYPLPLADLKPHAKDDIFPHLRSLFLLPLTRHGV